MNWICICLSFNINCDMSIMLSLLCWCTSLCRWYHSNLTGREAETLLLAKGQDGSFLVRASVHNPGFYVLSACVKEKVSHVTSKNPGSAPVHKCGSIPCMF